MNFDDIKLKLSLMCLQKYNFKDWEADFPYVPDLLKTDNLGIFLNDSELFKNCSY